MPKCQFCNKKAPMPLCCKQCNLDLCIGCYRPEKHTCEKYKEFLQNEKENFITKLKGTKCVGSKLEKI